MAIDSNFIPTIDNILAAYKSGDVTPSDLIEALMERAQQYQDRNIWISCISQPELQNHLSRIKQSNTEELPLYGVPFAVKDNIDVAGFDTTAGCPEYAYTAKRNATIIDRLINAGAIPLFKTNLDQFATGLVGTRSPYGPCQNSFDPDYISGGSSAGSAVSVALGLVSFSLGTDTAGSGRVPAMLNNLIGLKPSRGLFSMNGVIPACRSLDCPSVFAFNTDDATKVFAAAQGFDEQDSYSRPNPFANTTRSYGTPVSAVKLGVPKKSQLAFFDNTEGEVLFDQSIEKWRTLGADVIELDFEPLFRAARLLYEGPWVAERYAALETLMESNPEHVHEVVRGIVQSAEGKTAVDAFKSAYQLQEYKSHCNHLFEQVDAFVTPTAPRHYKIEEVLADPVKLNSNMGFYTNYMNLMDLCGVAVPCGFQQDGLPFGFTLTAPAFRDTSVLNLARHWQNAVQLPYGVFKNNAEASQAAPSVSNPDTIEIAVCGAHLQGFPLNWQLTERGARLKCTTQTAPSYRMYQLENPAPQRPGLIRDNSNGQAIEVEVWNVPAAEFGSFVANIPYPLGIGKVELTDGTWTSGFVCDATAIKSAQDISDYGSWRNWMNSTDS